MDRYLPTEFQTRSRADLISDYFNLDFSYLEILVFLRDCHGITLGLRQLNRILRRLGLQRKKPHINMHGFIDAIEHELSSAGYTLGYRKVD